MKNLTNKSGFTLIEIIVVLIIVGILAAIALPNLFSNVNKSKAEEALSTISSYRPVVEACLSKYAPLEAANCTAARMGTPAATSNFTYALGAAPAIANGNSGYSVVASGVAGGPLAGNTLTIGRAAAVDPAISTVVNCTTAGAQLLGAC